MVLTGLLNELIAILSDASNRLEHKIADIELASSELPYTVLQPMEVSAAVSRQS